MLSIIVYGRNDPRDVNYHRQAALNLNAFAELLSDSDDEILFTDWTADDDLPSLPEAIADTLTPHASTLLRVFRVRARERAGLSENGSVTEAVARNVAVRRSNPRNRWIVSADIGAIPFRNQPGLSLTSTAERLRDGHLTTDVADLPAAVWRMLPRNAPADAEAILSELGGLLKTRQGAGGAEGLLAGRFEDFHMFLRRDLFAIDGFNEDPLSPWPPQHDVARRLHVTRGAAQSLHGRLTMYRARHASNGSGIASAQASSALDAEIVEGRPKAADLPHQRDLWGLPDADVEEIRLDDADAGYRAALGEVVGDRGLLPADGAAGDGWSYDPSQVLPFLADILRYRDSGTRIGYAGTRADTASRFLSLAGALGFVYRIATTAENAERLGLTQRSEVEILPEADFVRLPDLFVFEFGTPRESRRPGASGPAAPDDVLRLLEAVVADERRAVVTPDRPLRRIAVIDAVDNAYEKPVSRLLDTGFASSAARLKHGFARMSDQPEQRKEPTLGEHLAARLGRPRPVGVAELAELQEILDEVAAMGDPTEHLAASVRVNGPALLAFLAAPAVKRARGDETVSRLEATVRGILAKRQVEGFPVAVNDRRPAVADRPLSGLAASGDWDDDDWRRFVRDVSPEAAHDRASARGGWIWERAHTLYGLDRLSAACPVGPVLVVCQLQDALVGALARRFERVDVLDVSTLHDTDGARARPGSYFLGDSYRGAEGVKVLSAAGLRDAPDGSYGAVVLPHASGFAHGFDGFVELLSQIEPKLSDGGIVAFSSHVRVNTDNPADRVIDLSFGGERGLLGRIDRETGFALADGLDMQLSGHDQGLIGPLGVPGLFAEANPGGVLWPAVFFLRKNARTPASTWKVIGRVPPELGDQTGRLHLSEGSRRTEKGISASPRRGRKMAFYGPYLQLLPGAYEVHATVQLPSGGALMKHLDGEIEVVAGDTRLAKMTTRSGSRLTGWKHAYVLPFEVPAAFDGEIEIRAIVSNNVAVQYSDVRIIRKENAR